ncbi:tRNA (adenine-N(6)-)-methyltransferase [Vibrio ichthyoenteri ATCC 700023]|uniref:tRNA1(Val) (adenine(37)-N6)-methyltransferase n=2 Tax=Vibrio ichthyoenteri TaxID=142461 RepID=F9S907_9VIBR|nr:tRNA (adenine-N(6)-)-methyltransferase [Vibrio ichthyoenteri ATCC 700023]
MPVSTDGVLLGAWATLNRAERILDIGTGTGLLALMCAQRNLEAKVYAIDIEQSAAITAQLNAVNSEWSERITVEHADIMAVSYPDKFDVIICNPPYFNNGEQAKRQSRATARHTDSLSHQHLLERCLSLLEEDGKASFVLPVVEGEQFILLAQRLGFSLTRLCRVQPTPTKIENRLLIELSLRSGECKDQQLIIRDKLGYTDAFIALTKDFYLKM